MCGENINIQSKMTTTGATVKLLGIQLDKRLNFLDNISLNFLEKLHHFMC